MLGRGHPPAAVSYGDADFTLTAQAANPGTGTDVWMWTSSAADVLQVTGAGASATVKVLKSGSATITAAYKSDTTLGSSTTALINVSKATVTVTAKDQSIYVGGTVPNLSAPAAGTHYTVSGLVGSDTLGGTITMAYQKDGLAAVPDASAAGTYQIVISGATADSSKYNAVVFENGTLTISAPVYDGGSYTPAYDITVEKPAHGSIAVSPKNAFQGNTVTITVAPDKCYTLETLIVLDQNGREITVTAKDGKYTFQMPASKVAVKGTFMEDNAMLNFFVDIPVEAYYYDAVLWAAKQGITGGIGGGLFGSGDDCTRAQIVTFLYRSIVK